MPRSSPKFSHEPLNEFFYELVCESGEDEETGIDGNVWYSLFRFANGMATEDLDEYNEKQSSFEDQLNAGEILMLCSTHVGAILKQTDDGFVSAELYRDMNTLEDHWRDILDDTTLEQCDECQAEAEEIGLGMPITHDFKCSQFFLAEARKVFLED